MAQVFDFLNLALSFNTSDNSLFILPLHLGSWFDHVPSGKHSLLGLPSILYPALHVYVATSLFIDTFPFDISRSVGHLTAKKK